MSAPTFALLFGVLYVGLGALGLASSLPALAGLHLFIGIWGLTAWSGALSALQYARATAVLLALLTLTGIAALAPPAILPLGGQNIWLHGFSALAAAWIGWRSLVRRPAATPAERRHGAGNRRVAVQPVAAERRSGVDRRQAY